MVDRWRHICTNLAIGDAKQHPPLFPINQTKTRPYNDVIYCYFNVKFTLVERVKFQVKIKLTKFILHLKFYKFLFKCRKL